MPSVDTTAAGSQALGFTGNWGRFPTLNSTDGFDSYLLRFQTAFAGFHNQDSFDIAQLPKKILVLASNQLKKLAWR